MLRHSFSSRKEVPIFSIVLLLHGCGGALFGVGNKGVEARVAVKRLEIRILPDVEICIRRESVVDCLSQERKSLVMITCQCKYASQTVRGECGFRMFRSKGLSQTVTCLELHFLCLVITALVSQVDGQDLHRLQCAGMLRPEDSP